MGQEGNHKEVGLFFQWAFMLHLPRCLPPGMASQALVLAHWAWSCMLLKPSEGLGILSMCTSEMCSWIQNFPEDSGSWKSIRTISIGSAWRGHSTSFLGRNSHSINTCSLRWGRSFGSNQAKNEGVFRFDE